MSARDAIVARCLACVDALGPAPTRASLEAAAKALATLDLDVLLHDATLAPARAGEERLYVLGTSGPERPALYLVSDAPGVTSPPHEHQTWALLVGLDGIERNHAFERSASGREVRAGASRDVGPGEWLAMGVDEIHATEVVSRVPTRHLHLYGRPLDALPPFAARCFVAAR